MGLVASGGRSKTSNSKVPSIDIPRDQFPVINTEFVRCNYATGSNRHKLIDPGSCRIPRGFTIRIEEWRMQQGA